MYKFLKSKSGLTLTELIVCFAVMAILAAVAVPVFNAGLEKARRQDCESKCVMVTTTVREIMVGEMDNGKPQPVIPYLCSILPGQHRVIEKKDAVDEDGIRKWDAKTGKYVKTNVDEVDWRGNVISYLEDHIDKNNDGECDVCKAPMNFVFRGNDHVDSEHLIYVDQDGNSLAGNAGFGAIGVKNTEHSVANEYTAFLLLEKATVGDIRGGYRFSEINVQNEWIGKKRGLDDKLAADLKAAKGIKDDEAREAAIKKARDEYAAGYEDKSGAAVGRVQQSAAPAQNHPSLPCNQYDYKIGCSDGYYLKRFKLRDVPVYTYFSNLEMPVCPYDEDGEKGYFYYLDADGICHCSHCG